MTASFVEVDLQFGFADSEAGRQFTEPENRTKRERKQG
jgi:hypothetical protein